MANRDEELLAAGAKAHFSDLDVAVQYSAGKLTELDP